MKKGIKESDFQVWSEFFIKPKNSFYITDNSSKSSSKDFVTMQCGINILSYQLEKHKLAVASGLGRSFRDLHCPRHALKLKPSRRQATDPRSLRSNLSSSLSWALSGCVHVGK